MEKKTVVDMTKAKVLEPGSTRKRRRSIKDIQKYWQTRYKSWVGLGFSKEEAIWAAENGISVRAKVKNLQDIISLRQKRVKFFMDHLHMTREQAIEKCAKDRESKLPNYRKSDMDNIFYEISP